MDDSTRFAVCLGGGCVAQLLLWTFSSRQWKLLLGGLLGATLGGFFVLRQMDHHGHTNALWAAVGLGAPLGAALMNPRATLPNLSERVLLFMNLAWIYLLLSNLALFHPARTLLWISIAPSLWALAVAFLPFRLGAWARLLTYVWFLVMASGMLVFAVPLPLIRVFLGSASASSWRSLDLFVNGMVLAVAASYVLQLFLLIPLPGKRQSFEDRMRQWRELADAMVSKHDDRQLGAGSALIILLGTSVILGFNHRFQWLPPLTAAGAVVVAPSLAAAVRRLVGPSDAAAPTDKGPPVPSGWDSE